MNIGIFETEHFEGVYPMIRIMDMPDNRLTIFVNKETYGQLKTLLKENIERYKWVVQAENVSNRNFVKQIYTTCKEDKIGLLFLNTVTANFMLYAWMAALLPSTKIIVTLHDANNFLYSDYTFNIRTSVRHVGKKALGRFCYGYSTVSETVQHHLKNVLKVQKKVFCIPGAIFEGANVLPQHYDSSQPLRIVVAGSIDNRRRDYDKVFELLALANKRSFAVTVVLAGGVVPASTTIIKKCREYCRLHNNLTFYETPILDQALFATALDNAHFIWIPSVIKTAIADNIEETYGLTKSSGNIFDAIKHARPVLAPRELVLPPKLYSSVLIYDSVDELIDLLLQIRQSTNKYSILADEALSNSMKYTVEKMRQRIKQLL